MTHQTRRQALSGLIGVALGGLAGCMDWSRGGRSYTLSLDPIEQTLADGVALRTDAQTEPQRTALRKAVSAKNQTVTTYGWQPFEDRQYVESNGVYYRVRVNQTDQTKSNERYVVYGRNVNKSAATDAVEMTTYPRRDYSALKHAVVSAHKTNETSEPVPTDATYVLHGATANNSALVPQPDHQYVTHNGEYIEIVVERRSVTEEAITSTVTQVAANTDEFVAYAEDEIVAGTLSSNTLSGKALEIVQTAITDEYGYDETVPLSDAYVQVLNHCTYEASSEGVAGEDMRNRQQYVKFENKYYQTRLMAAVP